MTGEPNLAILDIQGLTRRYGDLTAVDHLDLRVEAGTAFGLLGANGAGKTTVIKMLTTLLPPSAGTARVVGFDIVREAAQVRRMIGYVPQALSVDGALSGYENLLIFAKLCDVPRRERSARINEALELMGLAQAAGNLVRTYSGGMIRRLEIAQATLHRPPVLFLDEPTVGLDPLAREAVWEHVRMLRSRFGITIVLTTHYLEEADQLCDHLAILHGGRLVVSGVPDQLKAQAGVTTLDALFAHYAGGVIEGGSYRETRNERLTAQRLG
jgi:ABC-2 type transport system ATP-binding protein